MFKDYNPNEIQAYINKINEVKLASQGVFDATTVSAYANAVQGLEAKQAALLLSTQGLTNAQIAETLAVNESNVAKNYQAMVDAGLLAQRQRLTLAQIQENLQTVLGAEADTSAAMASLGLSAAIEGQEHQTVQLTTKKIQEAIATNALTQAQAQEFAMRTGVILSMQRQAVSVLPKWIATVKAATIAVLGQVKATAVWMATNPVGWITAAVAAIGGAIWAYKEFGDTVENAKEKVEDATEKFNKATSELENVETELSNIEFKIKELEALDSLTWVEQEELNRLREVTKELELQKQLKQETQLQTAENLFDSNKHLFEKEYKYFNLDNHDSNVRDVEEGLNTGRIGIAQIDFDNIDDAMGTLRFLQKEKEKLLTADTITEELQSQINEYDEFMEDIKHNFSETLSSLSEYKQNILEIASIRDLTQDEQDFYDYLSSMQKAIYEYYSPATWNNLEFDSIFDTKDIEKTKEELISMYKSGELSSAEMLEQFPKLNQAIKESEIIAGEGSDIYKEFFNEIAALAEGQADVINDVMEEAKASLSINETVDQLNTRLKPTFDTLKSAYQDIFTSDGFDLDAVDIPMLEDIRSAIEKLNESEDLDFNIDMGAFDEFAKVLTDTNTTEKEAQQAFDDLATSLFYATDATEGMSEETLKLVEQLLESLGVTNAEEVAMYALKDSKTQAVLATYDLTDATRDSFVAILDEGEAANLTRQEIYSLTAAEIAFGQNTLSTEQKIQQLRELASAYGDTTSAALATAIANDLASGHTDVDSAINDLMAKINNGVKKVDIDFSSAGTSSKKSGSSSKSSSKKDTTKEFDWIEQAIENVEKEVKNLDDVVNSAYSTFSQKNGALAQEIGKVSEEIELQQQAYDEYMRKADSIGLSEDYKVLVRDGAINIENISNEDLQKKISDYQQWYEKAVDVSDAISDLNEQLKDLHVKGYELQAERLEELLENEAITEKQYISEMTRLYKQYYEDQTDYAVQAHEAKMALLNKEKEYLNSVANAAASLFDKEIDKVQDNAKEQEKVYKARIKDAEKQKEIYQDQIKAEEKKIDAYNKEIDLINDKKKPLQDELAALEDKAKHENLILDLQKKQYDLAKAENQRTKLVYTEDKGMIYKSDPQAIRDAKKDVDDAKLEIQKYDIQKQIDAFDDEIEKINELIDAVNDHIDSINDQIDAVDEYIDGLNDIIDQINDAADAQVDALEKMKNKWQEVIDQQEEAKNLLLLTGEFGTDAINKILSGDEALLSQWKQSYIDTLSELDTESQGYIGDMTSQLAELYGVDLSPLQAQFNNVKESVNGMTESLGSAVKAIIGKSVESAMSGNQNTPQSTMPNQNVQGGAAGSLADAFTQVGSTANDVIGNPGAEGDGTVIGEFGSMKTAVNDVTDAITTDNGSLENAILEETETAIDAFDQHTEKITNGVIPAIQAATQEMNAFNESADMDIEKTITIHYETTGEKPSGGGNIAVGKSHTVGKAHVEGTVGKAFAEGTGKYKGLPKPEKNALVSEYGQTEMTVLPNGDTIITDEPTMMDLPKDTVIFNEEQTKQIMNNKPHVEGNAHADGTVTTSDGRVFEPYDPDKDDSYFSKLYKAWNKYYGNIDSNVEDIQKTLSHHLVMEHNQQMHEEINRFVNNSSVVNNTRNIQPVVNNNEIHVTLPNVTNSTSADALLRDLQSINLKKFQVFG